MKRILFVCHGNICRSPMAEFIMKAKAEKSGLASQFHIESAACSTEEIGNPVFLPARNELLRHGISVSDKRARLIERIDFNNFDIIAVMDDDNIVRMCRRICGIASANVTECLTALNSAGKAKIVKLKSFIPSDDDVADPWYTGKFDVTYNELNECIDAMLETI